MATKDRTSLKNDFANGKYATGEKFADLIDSMKVVQEPVVDPAASGTSLSFIDSVSQDADGKITVTKKTLDLENAHELNPFKGWYKTGDILPTDGFDGAYLYFKDTSEQTGLTTIYRWNGTTYADTGTVVDTSNVQTFGSGQEVFDVRIVDPNTGEDVSANRVGVAPADDTRVLNQLTKGLGFEEDKVSNLTEENYAINGNSGEFCQDDYGKHCTVALTSDITAVRFLAAEVSNQRTYPYGWAFYDSQDAAISYGLYKLRTESTSYAYEIILAIPEGAVKFAFSTSSVNRTKMYCFTQKGEILKDLIKKQIDKVEGELNALENVVNPFVIVDMSINDNSAFIPDYYYNGSYNRWVKLTGGGSYMIPVQAGERYELVKTGPNWAAYSVMQSDNHESESAALFATGYSNVKYINGSTPESAHQSVVLEIPTDGHFLYITWRSYASDDTRTPDSVKKREPLDDARLPEVIDSLTSNSKEDALSARQGNVLNDNINLLGEVINPFTFIELNSLPTKNNWRIKDTLKWYNAKTSACYVIPVTVGSSYRLYKPYVSGGYCNYAFLNGEPTYTEGDTPNFVTGYEGVTWFASDKYPEETVEFTIPQGCAYLYISKTAGENVAPTEVYGRKPLSEVDLSNISGVNWKILNNQLIESIRPNIIGLTKLQHQVDANGWEIPEYLQQQRVIDKSNQLVLLKWTPKHQIPADFDSNTTLDVIPADVPFDYGIPYSSNWQDYKYVGMTVSIYTFLTAVNNPYSLLYTECIKPGSDMKSAWGRKWNTTNGTSYYGLVCCGFTAAVTGCHTVWNNGDFDDLSEDYTEVFTQISKIGECIPEFIQIGDIFDSPTHSIAIYAIKRDANGNITDITVSECTRGITNGSGCRFYSRSLSSFKTYVSNFAHYRYNQLYQNYKYVAEPTDPQSISYSASTHIPTATQNGQTYTNEVCTFAGDKASFAYGDLIVINYNLDGSSMEDYTHIRVYNSEGTLVVNKTFAEANSSLSGIFDIANSYNLIDQTDHALVISTSEDKLEAGKYYACLSDGTNDSTNKTEFEVLDNGITLTDRGTYYEIAFTNEINSCLIGGVVNADGYPYISGNNVRHIPSYWELQNKVLLINKEDFGTNDINNLYIRLMTVGEYGVVRVIKKLVEE